jgi:hypothetical protein
MVQTVEQYILLYECLQMAIATKMAELTRDSNEDGFRNVNDECVVRADVHSIPQYVNVTSENMEMRTLSTNNDK